MKEKQQKARACQACHHGKDWIFSETNRKPLKVFEQRSVMIRFTVLQGHSGCCGRREAGILVKNLPVTWERDDGGFHERGGENEERLDAVYILRIAPTECVAGLDEGCECDTVI